MTTIETTVAASSLMGDRRMAAITRLDELRHEQGIALLEGKEFDHAALTALEREIAGLDIAEGEAARRERTAQEDALEARRKELRGKLGKLEEQRLSALERAEQAATELSDAIQEARTHGADIFTAVRMLGYAPPRSLDSYEFEHRLSWRLAAILKPITGLRRTFGQISFPDVQPRFSGPWRNAEAKLADPEITPARKGLPNGKA